jgi:hypothetical protein
MQNLICRTAAGLLWAAGCALPLQASAALGGDAATVEADRIAMSATALPVVNGAGYTVQGFTLASAAVVREYVSGSGTVFAVAWEGPLKPDLRQLLGRRQFNAVDDGTRERNREGRRGPMVLRPAGASNLVIESSGHMRAFAGRAWLTDQLPAGVDTDAIR